MASTPLNLRAVFAATADEIPALHVRPFAEASADRTTWLQETGDACGVFARDLQVGDTLVWNGNGTSIVKTLTPRGKTQVLAEVLWLDYSKEWKRSYRVLNLDRVVAVKFDGQTVTTRRTKEFVNYDRAELARA